MSEIDRASQRMILQVFEQSPPGFGEESKSLGELVEETRRHLMSSASRQCEPTPIELGWQTPPTARIPVALASLKDIDWALEPGEMDF